MPQYTEDDMAQAIQDATIGKPLRLAAREWGVPYHTLRDRIKGSESYSITAESQ
jgi:hypothetical protein